MTSIMAEAYSVSASQGMHSERHSRREYTPRSADRAMQKNNIVVYDCGDDRAHFNEFFRPAIEDYNARQTRADRKKSLDYLSALEDGTEGYGKGDKHEKPFYHEVIQIGNRDKNGVTDSSFDVDHWRELKSQGRYDEASRYALAHENHSKEREDLTDCLRELAEEIRDNKDGRYSGILVHGLVIHRDEPNGTDHLDMRISFVTTGEKTGLDTRVSERKGLAAMGFKTTPQQTALEQFRESIKDRLTEKMAARGYEREYLGQHRKHQPTEVYELEQRAGEAEARLTAAEAKAGDLAARLAAVEQRERDADTRARDLNRWAKRLNEQRERQEARQKAQDERQRLQDIRDENLPTAANKALREAQERIRQGMPKDDAKRLAREETIRRANELAKELADRQQQRQQPGMEKG